MLKKTIKIVIADDNRFFCDALQDSLNTHDELSVIQVFTSINDLTNYTKYQPNFDILILDINFNGESSLDFLKTIKPATATFKIIALTTMNNNFIKQKALNKGVNSFIGKDGDLSNFKDEILNCFQINQVITSNSSSKITIGNCTFTERKLEILQALYIHSDKKEKELSATLNITENSLKSHKRELFEITNTKNTPELIKFGIQNGLIIA